ncbi:Uroporphyrinogen decarboxylase (URO-D) [Methylomonas albis]|uniref:Uroporphyrinogen decarboxylase n=1 Tax=Methylomonas albis TaxID=1854563 RepID=A0ABR9CV05_9GAMM|nr:uroporphyrinogen decarboxylase family protein [Methylomonas albis]MBD9354665.1 uroporphyrinogen decarboxylase [Methylomonas albis]CAD6877559.1 Uroporphyrinogen decarboxylase (URO-D) [Methylomonas albis]
MTPLEILNAATSGAPAPRIPIFCNLPDHGARELGMPAKEYFSMGEYVADAQLRMLRRYGYDNIWSLHYVGKEAELLGCREILFADDGVPNVADFVIKNLDDIAKFDIPADITQHPAWQPIADCMRILRTEVGATHPICAYITASTTLPAILMGMDKWMELFLLGPFDIRDELLRKCSDFFQQEIAALRALGANVLIYSSPFGSPYFVSRKQIEHIVMPWMQRDLLPGGSEGVVYYCGMAPFNDVIDLVFDELHIKSHHISPLADIAEAKRLINTRGLTCGVIDDIKMIHWSAEQTRAEVKRIIEIGKTGGHFLFGNGVMPLAVPEANILAMVDAAFEYGRLE